MPPLGGCAAVKPPKGGTTKTLFHIDKMNII
jgi:hypothetical protein